MMFWAPLAIGAGAGLIKSEFVDRPKEERQRRLAAETQRFSPWTGLRANPIEEADPFGSALKYGVTGASMGANLASAEAQNKFSEAATNRLNSGGSLASVGGYNTWAPQRSSMGWGMDNNAYWERPIPGGWGR